MLIDTSLVVALLASSPLAARPLVTTPHVIATVIVASDIPSTLVTRLLAEAGDIWRAAGLTIVWRLESTTSPSSLRVIIGHRTGLVVRDDSVLPLGWIVFDDQGAPMHDIYVSYANARALMDQARGSVALSDQMPRAERDTMLGRAMGRALAHELGHYLLASKEHSVGGLMRARRTATEFFATSRSRFDVDAQQRAAIAGRLAPPAAVAFAVSNSQQSTVNSRQSAIDSR